MCALAVASAPSATLAQTNATMMLHRGGEPMPSGTAELALAQVQMSVRPQVDTRARARKAQALWIRCH
jgi:hypothetical protein